MLFRHARTSFRYLFMFALFYVKIILIENPLGELPVYKVVKAVPVIVLDGDVPKEPRNSK